MNDKRKWVVIAATMLATATTALCGEVSLPAETHALPQAILTENQALISTKDKTWLQIQRKFRNGVIQVFSPSAHFNWNEPYKTPDQFLGSGTGFFIDDKGHILTNFHVVEDAIHLGVQIPIFGKERFPAQVVSIYPEMDVALLQLSPEGVCRITAFLGHVPCLEFGDSDTIYNAQDILALGYPLGQENLKSTEGIISGRELMHNQSYLQTSLGLNPGNSGGPALNEYGQVIGINTMGALFSQNISWIIPINDVKKALPQMQQGTIIHKPLLLAEICYSTEDLVTFLKNPPPGGTYISKIYPGSILEKNGVLVGDMIYEINGFAFDRYGQTSAPWSEDRITIGEFLSRYAIGDAIDMVIYRRGERIEIHFQLEQPPLLPVRKIYSNYEPVDYEVIGGLVLMNLSENHLDYQIVGEEMRSLVRFEKIEKHLHPQLIISHVLPSSPADHSRILHKGMLIKEINGEAVCSIETMRKAFAHSFETGYLTIKTHDTDTLAVFSLDKIIEGEKWMPQVFFYPLSALLGSIMQPATEASVAGS